MSSNVNHVVTTATVTLNEPVQLERGGTLDHVEVGYELQGQRDGPLILALGGISATRHVTSHAEDTKPGWWEDFAGPGKPIDTDRFQLLCIDFLGGNGATSGARTSQAPFPVVAPSDQANVLAALVRQLGCGPARAFFGSSYGGMVALQFGRLHAELCEHLVIVGAAHRAPAMANALRCIQREIVRQTQALGSAETGLRLARAIGMATYRSEPEFETRFSREPRIEESVHFEIEDYLFSRGDVFAANFHPQAFLRLSESIDLQNMDPADVHIPSTIIGFDTDFVAPPDLTRKLADRLAGPTRLVELESIYGHDAFLKEDEKLGPLFRNLLAD